MTQFCLNTTRFQKMSKHTTYCNCDASREKRCSDICRILWHPSDLRATLPLVCKTEYHQSTTDSVALRLDCVDTQADLELHCSHMSEDNFSRHINVHTV